ncbi:hypothetical protein Trydic_g6245 [Trypoxylus dichotomus]
MTTVLDLYHRNQSARASLGQKNQGKELRESNQKSALSVQILLHVGYRRKMNAHFVVLHFKAECMCILWT